MLFKYRLVIVSIRDLDIVTHSGFEIAFLLQILNNLLVSLHEIFSCHLFIHSKIQSIKNLAIYYSSETPNYSHTHLNVLDKRIF